MSFGIEALGKAGAEIEGSRVFNAAHLKPETLSETGLRITDEGKIDKATLDGIRASDPKFSEAKQFALDKDGNISVVKGFNQIRQDAGNMKALAAMGPAAIRWFVNNPSLGFSAIAAPSLGAGIAGTELLNHHEQKKAAAAYTQQYGGAV